MSLSSDILKSPINKLIGSSEKKVLDVYSYKEKDKNKIISVFVRRFAYGTLAEFSKRNYVYTAFPRRLIFDFKVLERITRYYSNMLRVVADSLKTAEIDSSSIWSLSDGKVFFELIDPFKVYFLNRNRLPGKGRNFLKRRLVYQLCSVLHSIGGVFVKKICNQMTAIFDWGWINYINLYFCSTHTFNIFVDHK